MALTVAFALYVMVPSIQKAHAVGSPQGELNTWLAQESAVALSRLEMNISPLDTVPGLIIAAPSKSEPNYYYYWVRDGAMVMRSILGLYESSTGAAQTHYLVMLKQYVDFSRQNQTAAASNLGEPRFDVDGAVNTEPWGRPQNDGPALRALILTRFARDLVSSGQLDYVQKNLYGAQIPANTAIKIDLEYIAHNWQSPCIDLWEEIWGQHFFTRAVQLAALREGSSFALTMNDPSASAFYTQQADLLEQQLTKHWSPTNDYYLATLDSHAGPDHQKPSQLDTSVLIAVLAAEQTTGILSPTDGHILSTVDHLEQSFTKLYAINSGVSSTSAVGAAIGRYAEDYYFGGNPWFITTAALAELHYRLANVIEKNSTFVVDSSQLAFFTHLLDDRVSHELHAGTDLVATPWLKSLVVSSLFAKADSYMARIRLHTNATGALSEQFDRKNGFELSAPDLSWSYASFLRAYAARMSTQDAR